MTALNLFTTTAGSAHVSVAECYKTLATICLSIREYGLGVSHARKALEIHTRISGIDSSDVISCHGLLAELFRPIRAHDLEIAHLKINLKLTEFIGGVGHPGVGRVSDALADAYVTAGGAIKNGGFLELSRFYYERSMTSGGDNLMEKIHTMRKLAKVMGNVFREFEGAKRIEQTCYQWLKEIVGEDHQLTKDSLACAKVYITGALKAAENTKAKNENELLTWGVGGGEGGGGGGGGGGGEKKKKKKKKKSKKK